MKTIAVCLAVCSLVPCVAAAGFLAPRRTALAAQNLAHDKLVDKVPSASANANLADQREMPETQHQKKAGSGYHPGSPLYNKQEMRKENDEAGEPQAISKPEPDMAEATRSSGCWQKLWNPFARVDTTDSGLKVKPKDYRDYTNPAEHWKDFKSGYGICLLFTRWIPGTIMVFLFALIWMKALGGRHETYDERKRDFRGNDFAYGLCSLDHCFGHHAQVCLCSWCCSFIRIADTYSKNPFALIPSFWAALLLVCLLDGLMTVTLGYAWIVVVCVAVYFRQKLRDNYGIESGGSTLGWDCLFWFWCPCCAIAQEARQVEFVVKLGADKL